MRPRDTMIIARFLQSPEAKHRSGVCRKGLHCTAASAKHGENHNETHKNHTTVSDGPKPKLHTYRPSRRMGAGAAALRPGSLAPTWRGREW